MKRIVVLGKLLVGIAVFALACGAVWDLTSNDPQIPGWLTPPAKQQRHR